MQNAKSKKVGRSRSMVWMGRFLAAMSLALGLGPAGAQLSTASVNGTVRDSTGAVIVDAQVTLLNVSTGTKRTTASNSAGDYAFIDVAPGNYTISVARQGFETANQAPFVLYVNQTASFNFSLSVGSQVQQVTVAAETVELATSTENLGTVVSQVAVNALPLNGRNFTELLTLTPGASRADTGQGNAGGNAILIGSFGFPSVNGQMNRSNLYLMDGIVDEQFWFSEYAVQPIEDDIAEFKVQSHNDQSQFGGVMGGMVNIVTKSGTNQFHGDAWEFFRNSGMDARNPLLTSKTPLKQNVFGATVGGPALLPHYNGRDHTFFFGAYEGTRINTAAEGLYNVPTVAERNGDFSALSTTLWNPYTTTPDPANPGKYLRTQFANNNVSSEIDPVMQMVINEVYPAPLPTPVSGFNGVDTQPSITDVNNYTVRIDHQFNTSNSIWGRFSQFFSSLNGSGGVVGLVSVDTSNGQDWGAGYLHTFGNSATLQVSAGHVDQVYITNTNYTHAISTAGYDSAFSCGFIGPLPCQIPELSVTGFASANESYLDDNDGDIHQVNADFTKLIGRHLWQAGALISHNNESVLNANDNEGFSPFQTENLETSSGGNAMASFLIGAPTSGERRNNLKIPRNGWVDGVYAGDQWKLSQKLTMNIGLRYDWDIMPALAPNSTQSNITGAMDFRNGTYILSKAAAGLGSCATLNAAPCIPGGALPANVVQGTSDKLINNQIANIQPRLGFAYQIHPTLVAHLGYDRVYDDWSGIMQMTQNEGALWPSFGLDITSNLNSTTVTTTAENPLNLAAGQTHTVPLASPFTQSANFIAPYLKNPYSDQWTVGLQQMFGANTMMSLNYVGSRTAHMPCCVYYNVAITPGPGSVSSRAPFPYISPTQYEQSNGSSIYDAMQVQLQKRMSSGLAYTVNYTWSKTIDVACDGYFGAEGCFIRNPYNPAADRSVAGIDLPQMVTANVMYQLPFGQGARFQTGNSVADAIFGGWELNAITTFTSGSPFTVLYSGDEANTGNTYQGINQVGNPHLAHPTISEWFNTAAFAPPAQYTEGDVPRNTLRTDWYRDLDASVFRKFNIEKTYLEFRAEAFNFTNTPVWGTPGATLNSATFGQISSTASTQRELQLALKFYF
jgi:Carboxypeptidase regulatory-like domain/TonB dependent receptor